MEVCSQNLNDPYTVLLKVNGNKCNMACEYCSELPKKFSTAQCTYNYEKFKDFLIKLPKNTDIIFHGGEPTLIGKDNIQKLVMLIKDLGYSITPTVQTNGFLDEEWVQFFKKFSSYVKVSVSIDGDEVCNVYRKTYGDKSDVAYSVTDRFLHDLDKNGVEFRCIATINHNSWRRGHEIVRYFSQYNNLKFLRINPCFDIDENGIKSWAISPSEYLECLKSAFIEMISSGCYKKIKIDPIMDIVREFNNETNVYQFKCNKFSSLFPDGLITSCDAMREIVQEIEVDENMFQNFNYPDYTTDVIEMCNKCPHISICKGGCPPLLHRYRIYASKYIGEYCQYRIGIRLFIKKYIEGEPV